MFVQTNSRIRLLNKRRQQRGEPSDVIWARGGGGRWTRTTTGWAGLLRPHQCDCKYRFDWKPCDLNSDDQIKRSSAKTVGTRFPEIWMEKPMSENESS